MNSNEAREQLRKCICGTWECGCHGGEPDLACLHAEGFIEGYKAGVREAQRVVTQYGDENAVYYEAMPIVSRKILKLLDEGEK